MSHLEAILRHRIALVIERKVHVLSKQGHQVSPIEPSIDARILNNFLPDLPLFTTSGLGQILCCVELSHVWERTRLSVQFGLIFFCIQEILFLLFLIYADSESRGFDSYQA